jgi:hypothetical protein
MGLDGQQRLMLLGGDALVTCGAFAEGEEIADSAPEFAERLIIGGFEARRGGGLSRALRRRRARGVRWLFQTLNPAVTAPASSRDADSRRTRRHGVIISHRAAMKSRRGSGQTLDCWKRPPRMPPPQRDACTVSSDRAKHLHGPPGLAIAVIQISEVDGAQVK